MGKGLLINPYKLILFLWLVLHNRIPSNKLRKTYVRDAIGRKRTLIMCSGNGRKSLRSGKRLLDNNHWVTELVIGCLEGFFGCISFVPRPGRYERIEIRRLLRR